MLLFSTLTYSQDTIFQGMIAYKQEYLDVDSLQVQMLESLFGTEQHYYIKGNSYKAYDQNAVLKQLYDGSTNSYYFVNPQSNEVMVISAQESTSELLSVEMVNGIDTVLNMECKMVKINTSTDETIYWYSPKVSVTAADFKDHNFGNWNALLSKTNGALPLKYITRSPNFTLVATAIKIESQDLNSSDFDIKKVVAN